MKISSDYKDLLKSLNAGGVRYLIVGGYALMVYTEPRYTKDIDVWIDRSKPNAEAAFRALGSFGAPLKGLKPSDFTSPEVFYQIGIDPVRVDVLTSLPGLEFETAWQRRTMIDFDGELVPVIAREDLLLAKAAAGRLRDRKHASALQKRRKTK